MKKILLFMFLVLPFISQAQKIEENYNILIVPDLSNRIDPSIHKKPYTDTEIVSVILDIFAYTDQNGLPKGLYKSGNRNKNQKDRISVKAINNTSLFTDLNNSMIIDLGEFDKSQAQRIEFLNGNATYTINDAKKNFLNAYQKMNDIALKNQAGADMWQFLQNGVDKHDFKLTNPMKSKFIEDQSKNIFIIFTDGYIETGYCDTKKKSAPYLTNKMVNNFRNAFLNRTDKSLSMKEFFKKNGYGIEPVKNPVLADCKVIVAEMYDRSINANGIATKNPTDMEILKLFWSDFLEKSGCKDYHLVPIQNDLNRYKVLFEDYLQ
ncbi:hypothetical protein [Flammeovirga aprica]|uniref:VWFA domain-containing protein n=1 Tax=Flammeovirga aprica JL-4 TaxID=694437 RepID=A0A7X9RTV9_9BACT|nr:hypothetical protein [Flammeovirga aprica]NME68089.1 hypothetical protein [Flammeovirga aprica JL-4]